MTFGIATFTMVLVKIEVKKAESAAAVASHRAVGENTRGVCETAAAVMAVGWTSLVRAKARARQNLDRSMPSNGRARIQGEM